MQKVDYLLIGTHQAGYLEVTGQGQVDNSVGRYNLDLNIKECPNGWDPHIIPLMCCVNLEYYAAKLSVQNKLANQRSKLKAIPNSGGATGGPCGQRFAAIVDGDGKMVALIRARGYLYIEDDIVTSRTVVLEGFYSRLADFGGIKQVHSCRERITKTIPRLALGINIFKVECYDGTILFGHRSVPYNFDVEQIFDEPLNLEVSVDSSGLHPFKSGSKQVSVSVEVQETTHTIEPFYK